MNSTQDIRKPRSGKKWVGIVFLIIGLIMLSRQMGVFVPHWVISWPMLLILIGLVTGSKHQFRNPSSFILIFLGGIFLLDEIFSSINFHDFAWPILIMGIGLYLIVGKRKSFNHKVGNSHQWDKRVFTESDPVTEGNPEPQPSPENHTDFRDFYSSGDDYLDTVSVFGGVKKNVVSKNFRGGEVTTIMGGAEINFIQADIHGTVVLEVTQLFGGTKIIVPQQWKVSSEMVALFGGIEDRRPIMPGALPADEKLLIIKGTSIFGGIDIRSF